MTKEKESVKDEKLEKDIITKLDLMGEPVKVDYAPYQQRIKEIFDLYFTPEVQQAVQAYNDEKATIEEEYRQVVADKTPDTEAMKNEITTMVLKFGETVKGKYWRASFVKGRAGAFETDKLLGYAAAHPEILKFKKPDGKPSVSYTFIGDE
jgi:hypothetical protein